MIIPTEPAPNVILVLGSETDRSGTPPQADEKTRWPCHKHILSKHSKYFEAMFSCEFEESGATIIFMPRGIFSSANILDYILQYMYTSTFTLVNSNDNNYEEAEKNEKDKVDSLDNDYNKHENYSNSAHYHNNLLLLVQLQDMYSAADYLVMPDLCHDLIIKMTELAHQFNCYCSSCTYMIPSIYAYTQPRSLTNKDDPNMIQLTQSSLAIMTSDPEKALASYWTCPAMIDLLWSLFSTTHAPPTIDNPLTESVLNHISKTSAIESLHGCYIGMKQLEQLNDEHNAILHQTFKVARQKATKTIATYFGFYCSAYPTLLSCIDGIIYTSDFTEYLLRCMIHDQMTPDNAGWIYQGIVRDLMSRHAVQHSSHLLTLFTNIKNEIIKYMFYHIKDIQARGALEKMDSSILNVLAQDLALPIDRLVLNNDSIHHHHQQHQRSTTKKLLDTSSWTKLFNKSKRIPKKSMSYIVPKFENMNEEDEKYIYQQHIKKQQQSNNHDWSFKSLLLKWNKTYQMEIHTVTVGKRVELIHRPILTTGTVAFVGHVAFADGIMVGVELDRRVGKTDGSVDGQRYFKTSTNRGEFVRLNELSVIIEQS
ncbi:hypothetical protein BJ944DRAFT_267544 [Cunninghamella echinulata]|nr:hypothetical protein BJ944DRAFT_267544 [Cunninghamella echinulata]